MHGKAQAGQSGGSALLSSVIPEDQTCRSRKSLGSIAGDQTHLEFEGGFVGTWMDLSQLKAEPHLEISEVSCYLSLC